MKRASIAASVLVLAAGCRDECATHTMTFTQIRHSIINTSCAVGSTCHTAAIEMGDQDLESAPYEAWVNVTPTNVAAADRGWKRVFPLDETQSFVYRKVTLPVDQLGNSLDPALGGRMPDTNTKLDDDSIAELQCWIRRGAPND